MTPMRSSALLCALALVVLHPRAASREPAKPVRVEVRDYTTGAKRITWGQLKAKELKARRGD